MDLKWLHRRKEFDMEKINKFFIINVKMKGFKRFEEEYSTGMDTLTVVYGGNGQGKTTIADAISYAFCGTPFWGEKSCDRLQNPNSADMMVEIRFVDGNGEVHTLMRRKSGSDTAIIFDTVQVRQKDLISLFAEKDIFLSLLNPLYFIEKVAENGREFLQKLLPPVKQAEVLEKLSDGTKALLENESLLDPEFYIKKRREEIRELDESNVYIEGQIDLLKNQRADAESKLDDVLKRGEEIANKKAALEQKQFDGIDVETLKRRQSEIAKNNSDEARKALFTKEAEIRNRKYESKFTDEIIKAKSLYEQLGEKYKTQVSRFKKLKVGDICPVCKTAVTSENIKTIAEGIKADALKLREQGQNVASALKELFEMNQKSMDKFEEFKADDLKKVTAEIEELESGDISEIAMIEDKIRLGNLSEDEYAQLQELNKQAELFAVEVNSLAEAENKAADISSMEKTIAENNARKKELSELINAVGAYIAAKTEITLLQLKMEHAAIKLFDVVKTTGEVKDVFRFTYDGKDYRWLSASEKIKAGLEVSAMLSRLTGLVYPVYIDNAEGITTKLAPIKSQVILAYAKNCPLTVQMPRKQQKQQVKEAA